jgi:hypothetical protein
MKFLNVLAIDFIDENYTNIGAFTEEHLTEILMKVKNVPYSVFSLNEHP